MFEKLLRPAYVDIYTHDLWASSHVNGAGHLWVMPCGIGPNPKPSFYKSTLKGARIAVLPPPPPKAFAQFELWQVLSLGTVCATHTLRCGIIANFVQMFMEHLDRQLKIPKRDSMFCKTWAQWLNAGFIQSNPPRMCPTIPK